MRGCAASAIHDRRSIHARSAIHPRKAFRFSACPPHPARFAIHLPHIREKAFGTRHSCQRTVGADMIRPPQQRNGKIRSSPTSMRYKSLRDSRYAFGAQGYRRGGSYPPAATTNRTQPAPSAQPDVSPGNRKKILPRGEDQTDQNCSRLIPISGSGLRPTTPGRIRITISQVAETTARFRCPPKTSHRAFPALMCRC